MLTTDSDRWATHVRGGHAADRDALVALYARGQSHRGGSWPSQEHSGQVHAPDADLGAAGASGENFGTVDCATLFGKGVQHDTLTVTATSPTTATVTGPFKQFFDTGTIHGTVKLAASTTSAGVVTYTGVAKISGGSGAYKHVRGSAKVECSSPDGGTHITCTEKATRTHT